MPNDMMVENPMVLSFPEPKRIPERIDESDLAGLKKAADLLEEITDGMNARIELMERANSNPFERFDMVRYAEKICGRR